ncbi:hypothetical protein CEE45_07740 [Candidatus Heimdallarchaeota archaeon B3_Heim]|nr:MAG: hypothetical protein CEE45_07740 [Candidatus Heimdallarchaeota archaeon B3_Heim]
MSESISMQEAIRGGNEILDLYKVTPSKYTEVVNAALTGSSKDFWLQQKSLNSQLQNQSYMNVISSLEKDQPLAALSRQIFLTEAIEKLTGQFISEKMALYRGFLLNWEKVLLIFNIFVKISRIFSITNLSKTAYQGVTSVQDIFENLWDSQFPFGVMRPGIALKQLDHTTISMFMRSINGQRRMVKRVRKIIENSVTLKKALNSMNFLSNSEIVDTSLAGPIARASGVISLLIDLPTFRDRKSSLFYSQFAYGKTPSPLKCIEICYSELILALERMAYLLPKFQGSLGESTLPENSGQYSISYPTTFGINHLTIELEGEKARYINYIPFEAGNIGGISMLVVKNSDTLIPYLLTFLNPEIELI